MRLGFVVNPIAGMGGRVGLKGTDGMLEEATRRGAKPISALRAVEFLEALKRNVHDQSKRLELVTCRGSMGENELKAAGLAAHKILPIPGNGRGAGPSQTTGADTKDAIRAFGGSGVEVVVFVGGDGTARDVLDAINELEANKEEKRKGSSHAVPPVLGVPSGVKMYSAVFALNPVDAAQILSLYADGKAEATEREVMDVDEREFRRDQLSIKLYGYLKCLYVPSMSQASKELSPDILDEKENQRAIAKTIIEHMQPDGLYILGPGTTMKTLAEMLNVEKTTLGVDILHKGKIVALDANEEAIIDQIKKHGGEKNAWIVVSPIGRQGMIFGRGNQQISPIVLERITKDHIIVAATKSKMQDLDDGTLKVDTGDRRADRMLRGYIKVITDYREWRMLKVR